MFLDSQAPQDLVNAMVRLSCKVKSDESADLDLTDHMKRCLLEGIFTEDVLRHEMVSSGIVRDVYEPRHAIHRLKKICAIVPLRDNKGMQEYVMMCLLPHRTEDEIRRILPRSPRVPPLLVHFDNDCVPNGCFEKTIFCLIMWYGWDLLRTLERKQQCLAHNIVQFADTPTVPMEITLVSSTGYFEVHAYPKNSQEDKYCPEIHSDVISAVKDALKMMHCDISIKAAVLCQCTHPPYKAEPHAATVVPPHSGFSTISPATVKCTNTKRRYYLKDVQRVWTKERNYNTTGK